jgi:D-glycero-alpha-D-manno-heptose 1-phosphate guanylyltransferase
MEAVVLAGGMGTRLKQRVADRPKPMALVAGRPFLDYVLASLERAGVRRVVLAVSYLASQISDHYGSRWNSLELDYSLETAALGTGGGFRLAMEKIRGDTFWALNGDSLLECDFKKMKTTHQAEHADLTIALRKVPDASRYGAAVWNGGQITGFQEKGGANGAAWINGGVYFCPKKVLNSSPLGQKFSFEKEILEVGSSTKKIWGVPCEGFFIDIGVPEDFDRAQNEPYLKGLIS